MFADLPARSITAFHEKCLGTDNWSLSPHTEFKDGVWQLIELNHRFNNLLWKEEDLARRENVPDSEIAKNKRAIDRYNQ